MKNLLLLSAGVFLAGVIWGCGGGGSGSSPTLVNANVRGQLIMPEQVDLPKFEVYLDNNLDPTDGFIKKDSGVCQCQDLVDYFFVDAPEGTYFIYAIVRINSAEGANPVVGDFVGYYSADNNPPSAPNAVVSASGAVDFQINMLKLL